MMNAAFREPPVKRKPGCLVRLIRKMMLILLVLGVLVTIFESAVFWELYAKLFFGVDTLHSEYDGDGDGIDDYTDIVKAAREYVRTDPIYDSAWSNGKPPLERGVCTDVIWRALEAAGYDFKALLDEDVRNNPSAYPNRANSLIDFRRVTNLMVFFERHCQKLTKDVTQIDQWQPGDIVFYSPSHVAIVSDRRGLDGQPWIIHFTSNGAMEEDNLDYSRLKEEKVVITGHYRWALK